jgi:signal transduction histidine kinase
MSLVHRHVIAPLRDGRAPRRLALLASAIPLGTAWFVFLVVGWSLGLGLAITLLGLPILFGVAAGARVFAELERRLMESLVGVRTARPGHGLHRGSLVATLRSLATDAASWRDQAFLMLRFVVGLPLAVLVIAVVGAGVQMTAAVTFFYASPIDIGIWSVDTLTEAILVLPLGLLVLALSVPLVQAVGELWIRIARGVLGPATDPEPRRPPRGPGVRVPRPGRNAMRGLGFHAAAYAAVNLILVVIWVATTPGGYFWPFWTLVPLGTILAIHAVIVGAPWALPDAGPRGVALARTAGVCGAMGTFTVAIWLFTTPGSYFWPVWVLIGLAVIVGLHALRVVLGVGERDEMAERIDTLTATRAGAVDAQAAELRRIERDLHDGAQARLVSLAMDLGMAREKLDGAPDEARTLVTGAHEEAKRALVELRDLARGIHPAVLTDRGLAAALGSLSGASRIPLRLEVDVRERLDPPLEAAAYFVVSEAIANAAKHSGATAMEVAVVRDRDRLRVRVTDDGVGGADPDGDGLVGMRRRVEAHDGVLRVTSPAGAGTTIEAVIPCAS